MIARMGEAPLCVLCRTRPVDEPWRPFCSERCRNEDLARWAEERYKMAAEPAPDTAPDAEADPD
jgi:endogenous inhibitor of DNA gyrase (YacG/DUF329 family)